MMRRPKVMVFTIYDLSVETGSNIWARHFLESMTRMPDMEFLLAFSGPERNRSFNQDFVERLGFNQIFIPFQQPPPPATPRILEGIAKAAVSARDLLVEKYYFWGERESRRQKHLDAEFVRLVMEKRPNLILIIGMSATLYVPSVFSLAVPCCLVSLNNEIPLYRDLKSLGGLASMGKLELWIYRHFNWISNVRARVHIVRTHKRCRGIVTLTSKDLPSYLPDHVLRVAIPPILNKNKLEWSYCGTRTLLFVGNLFFWGSMMHFANRLAIEWLCTRFAPELALIDNTARIRIIGAREGQVPNTWKHWNVELMGPTDREEVISQMTRADLFVAPISNNYGAKLKLAECVSYGTPFMATEGAMSGLPFLLTCMPRIRLEEPAAAARTALEYINSPDELMKLSQAILTRAQKARAEEDLAWNTLLMRAMTRVPPERELSRPPNGQSAARQHDAGCS